MAQKSYLLRDKKKHKDDSGLKAVSQITQNKISKTHIPVSIWKDPQEKIDVGEMTQLSKTRI